ncbi:putative secreted protein (Por secretion system target) [Kordia periserrulae]|uniref:Putative secreted protein (Por secretion system target) n=1 Tax=Kordia periserrulae TaxID=701523 RepID=A0A2T6BY10_9FLAO|nr:T9SS type A sorting domain-containing protein [Kordia periserrulae]PTX60847.1 putative secreted protein (Por secretion system target) [Kordia periserrulae]
MKNIIRIALVSFVCLLAMSLKAQDGYTYTFQHNGAYNFTVQAVPNASANTFAPLVQSYGFTIIVPDGVTIDIGSATSLGGGASATFFDGTNVGMPSIDGYLITETLGSPATYSAPSTATNTNTYTFTVNGSPTSGTMYILENNSALATSIAPLKSFKQADMIDDGSTTFVNVVDPNASAVSGMSTFDFNTLSVEEQNELSSLSLYPNPASDIVKIQVPNGIQDIQIEVFDNTGKQIPMQLSQDDTIDVSNIASGLYLIHIMSNDIKTTKKLIVK